MNFFMFNPMYYLFAMPALLLGMYAQYKVRSSYSKYQEIANRHGITGMEAARRLLGNHGMHGVSVNETRGHLTDHYDPRNNSLHLSSGVARSASVAALGIVAHEVGHAMQKQDNYFPMRIRSGLVPMVRIGSWLGPILFMIGLLMAGETLALAGLLLFSGTLVFSLVTLPVEFNASRRAMAMLKQSGLVSSSEEEKGVQDVLSAASLTYVAAAIQALSTILYYLFILSGSRRRR